MEARFIDLFAGIGGFRLGMERAGHECVGFCEIDKHAVKSYRAMYDTKGEWFSNDITTVEPRDMPDFDILTGGFPCQSFSIAGKRGGFEDTRGTLFFEIARIIKERQPQLVFLENVRGLLSHDEGQTFGTILNTFWELGYDAEWQLLNSKDFGVPQNRERIFIIAYPGGRSRGQIFPVRGNPGQTLKEIIGGSQGYRVYDIEGISCTLASEAGGLGAKTGLYMIPEATKQGYAIAEEGDSINLEQPNSKTRRGRVGKGVAQTLTTSPQQAVVIPVLTPDRLEKRQNGRRFKEDGEPMFTLTAQDRHGVSDGVRIRKLTPKECWRLQGFPDELFEKARQVNSDSQLYKQAGNSVTVNVIYEIAKRLRGD